MKRHRNAYDTRSEWPFYVIVLAMFLLMAGKGLLSTGMFLDGLIYDCIARNMAEGIGSLWHPTFTATVDNPFYGHPPLAFFALSMFYRVLGDGIWVGKAYSLLMFALSALLTVRLWVCVTGSRHNGWLPLLLYLAVSGVVRSSYSNMLEVSMSPLILSSVLLTIKAYNAPRISRHHVLLLLSGALMAGAALVKGPTGLYPIVFPLLLALTGYGSAYEPTWSERIWRGIIDCTLIAVGAAMTIAPILFCNDDAMQFVIHYFDTQIVGGMSTEVVSSRWTIVGMFFERTLPVYAIAAALLLWGRMTSRSTQHIYYQRGDIRLIAALLALTLCGVLPMMVTLKQRSFYLLTVYPFLAVSVAAIVNPFVSHLLRKMGQKSLRWLALVSLVLVGAACGYQSTCYGKPDHCATMQEDAKLIYPYLQPHETIAIAPEMSDKFSSLHGYYYRDRWVSLDSCNAGNRYQHLLLDDERMFHQAGRDTAYKEIRLDTKEYKLYRRKE